MKQQLPLSKPQIGISERYRLGKVIRSGWLTQAGSEVALMEKNLMSYYSNQLNSNYKITSTSNGTTALHLALLSLNIGPGDEVVIPNFAFVAVVNSVLYVGATPVVVDVDPVTWNIDAREVLKVLSKNTKAIIAVDNYGKSNNFNLLRKLLPSYIYLIQDAAESFPGFNKDQYLSEQGDLTIMSFYANKIITAGEGGAIFAHKNLIDRINILKNQAQVLNMNFVHGEVGYNYRISNLHAAVFNAQWSKLKKLQRARSKIYQNYLNELNTRNIKFSTNIDDFSARWLFTIKLLHFKNDIQFIRNYLKENGIETRPGFTPYSSLAYLQDKCVFTGSYKNSLELFNNTISLPTYPGLKIKQIKFIITKLCEVIEK